MTGLLAEREARQLLSGRRATDPVAVAERLLAIQAQDLRGALLAIRARSRGLDHTVVEAACTDDRTLVVTWLNRGTLHLVRSADYAWLHPLTAPTTRTMNARRLDQEGVSPADADRGARVIVDALDRHGPLPSDQLREHLDQAGIRTEGQALIHLLLRASLDGHIVRGPFLDGAHAYVLTRDWIGTPPPMDRDRALGELARRYLAGHGPADAHDLAKWSGLPLRDTRVGLRSIGDTLTERADGLLDLRGQGHDDHRRDRDSWASSTRCSTAGDRATTSSDRTGGSSPSTASSGRSRSSGARQPGSGASSRRSSRCARSRRSPTT